MTAPPPLMRHTLLDPAAQWRCAVYNRGAGTVVARIDLMGATIGYDVELDAGRGFAERVLPCELRAIRDVATDAPCGVTA